MPITKCTKDGKSGWKAYPDSPTCYIGKDAKKRALKQLLAINYQKHKGNPKKASKEFQKEMSKGDIDDLYNLLSEEDTTNEEIEILASVLNLSLHQRMNLSIARKNIQKQKENTT